MKPPLTGIILEELTEFLRQRGAPTYRAKQITDWIYKKRVASFEAMSDLPNELRAELAAEFEMPQTEVVGIQADRRRAGHVSPTIGVAASAEGRPRVRWGETGS